MKVIINNFLNLSTATQSKMHLSYDIKPLSRYAYLLSGSSSIRSTVVLNLCALGNLEHHAGRYFFIVYRIRW